MRAKKGILGERVHYKPFDYEWAFEYFEKQNTMHWIPQEVPLHEDVKDWNQKLSKEEKNLLTQIFRFFTQADCDIASGYYDKYIPIFKKPELRMMLGAFAAFEGIHQHAYSLLLDTVGMPEAEYQAFMDYKQMAEKHDYMSNFDPKDKKGLAKTLAAYSAFGEGMQLFSSFIILLNFSRFNKMKGMCQIITWSIRDESLHVEGMTRIFKTFIEENPEIWTDEFKKELYDIAREMVKLEDKFIDLAFEQGGIEGLDPKDVKKYIRYIADRRLLQLGLKPNFKQKENPLEWVDHVLNGVEFVNFFEQRATEYSKGTLQGSWDDVWSKE